MKPQTYFRIALLTPFILWVICLLLILPISILNLETPEAWNILPMPALFYLFGILLWFIPYLILAIGLWVWSKDKKTSALRNAALLAPILFFCLMLLETTLVYATSQSLTEFLQGLPALAATLGGLSLVFGYLCVGIALGLYKFLRARNLISQHEMPPPLPEA